MKAPSGGILRDFLMDIGVMAETQEYRSRFERRATLPAELIIKVIEILTSSNHFTFYGLVEMRLVSKLFDYEICRTVAKAQKPQYYRLMSEAFFLRMIKQIYYSGNPDGIPAISLMTGAVDALKKERVEEWKDREEDILQSLCNLILVHNPHYKTGAGFVLDASMRTTERAEILQTAAIAACYLGSKDSLEAILKLGAGLHEEVRHFGGLLIAAVCGEHIEMVDYLLDKGVRKLETGNHTGDNVLSLAVLMRRRDIFDLLLKYIDKKNHNHTEALSVDFLQGPIIRAIEIRDFKVAQVLLDKAAGEARSTSNIRYCAAVGAYLNGDKEAIEFLMNNKNEKKSLSQELLLTECFNGPAGPRACWIQIAARSGNVQLLNFMLDLGALVGSRWYDWDRGKCETQPDSLVMAIRHGHIEGVRALLYAKEIQYKSAPFPASKLGYAVKEAAGLGYLDIIKLLYEYGVRWEGDVFRNVLEQAAMSNQEKVLRYLVDGKLKKFLPTWDQTNTNPRAQGLLHKFGLYSFNKEAAEENSTSDLIEDDADNFRPLLASNQEDFPSKMIKLVPALKSEQAYCRCVKGMRHYASRSYLVDYHEP